MRRWWELVVRVRAYLCCFAFVLINEVYHVAKLERVLIEDTNNSSQDGERNFLAHQPILLDQVSKSFRGEVVNRPSLVYLISLHKRARDLWNHCVLGNYAEIYLTSVRMFSVDYQKSMDAKVLPLHKRTHCLTTLLELRVG